MVCVDSVLLFRYHVYWSTILCRNSLGDDWFMKVAIVIGSDSDWPIMKPAVEILKQFGIESEVVVASAHRTPAKVRDFVLGASSV